MHSNPNSSACNTLANQRPRDYKAIGVEMISVGDRLVNSVTLCTNSSTAHSHFYIITHLLHSKVTTRYRNHALSADINLNGRYGWQQARIYERRVACRIDDNTKSHNLFTASLIDQEDNMSIIVIKINDSIYL